VPSPRVVEALITETDAAITVAEDGRAGRTPGASQAPALPLVIAGLGAAAWRIGAQQDERIQRIGVLMAFDENDPKGKTYLAVFAAGHHLRHSSICHSAARRSHGSVSGTVMRSRKCSRTILVSSASRSNS
jgi:hypothetical protein